MAVRADRNDRAFMAVLGIGQDVVRLAADAEQRQGGFRPAAHKADVAPPFPDIVRCVAVR